MPVNDNYPQINVAAAQQAPNSLWHDYQQLIALRAQYPVFHYGVYDQLRQVKDTLIFSRRYRQQRATVTINFGENYLLQVPTHGKVLFDTRTVPGQLTHNDIVIFIEDSND
jgi:trehalose-6-phosphate hydrolase